MEHIEILRKLVAISKNNVGIEFPQTRKKRHAEQAKREKKARSQSDEAMQLLESLDGAEIQELQRLISLEPAAVSEAVYSFLESPKGTKDVESILSNNPKKPAV